MLLSISIFAQRSRKKEKKNIDQFNNKVVFFTPHRKLLNEEVWKRVSEIRFECDYLRLAVEWKDYQYVLLEMDEGKRILAKSDKYSTIAFAIVNLTLNPRPMLMGSSMAQNTPEKIIK